MARVINITGKAQGRLLITPPGGSGMMLVRREYRLTGDDPLLGQIPLGVLSVDVEWADVPQNIRDALVAIDAWTSAMIDDREGLA